MVLSVLLIEIFTLATIWLFDFPLTFIGFLSILIAVGSSVDYAVHVLKIGQNNNDVLLPVTWAVLSTVAAMFPIVFSYSITIFLHQDL